jgi:hypothetical protein
LGICRNSGRKVSGRWNSGGASSHEPPPLAARGSRAAASNWKTAGSGSASSPLPFLAGGDNHRHLQKKKKRKQQWVLFFFICPVPIPSPFSVYFPSADDGFGGWESFFFSSASGGGKTKGVSLLSWLRAASPDGGACGAACGRLQKMKKSWGCLGFGGGQPVGR